jgi:hypothetical protein
LCNYPTKIKIITSIGLALSLIFFLYGTILMILLWPDVLIFVFGMTIVSWSAVNFIVSLAAWNFRFIKLQRRSLAAMSILANILFPLSLLFFSFDSGYADSIEIAGLVLAAVVSFLLWFSTTSWLRSARQHAS